MLVEIQFSTTYNTESIGSRFELARVMAGLSRGQIAKMTGVDRSIIEKIETDGDDKELDRMVFAPLLASYYATRTEWLMYNTCNALSTPQTSALFKLAQPERNRLRCIMEMH